MVEPQAKLTLDDADRLVGGFMRNWSSLETQLNLTIRRILRIDSLAMAIFSPNLAMLGKLYVARSAVAFFGDRDSVWQKAAQKTFIDMMKLSTERNMVAHTSFGVSKDGTAVEFYPIKATSQLSLPEVFWTPADFAGHEKKMRSLKNELMAISERTIANRSKIDFRSKDTRNIIAELIAAGSGMSAKLSEPPPGFTGLLGHIRKLDAD